MLIKKIRNDRNAIRLCTVLFILLETMACSSSKKENVANEQTSKVPSHPVGHIEFDPAIDDPDFKVCNQQRMMIYSPHEGVGYEGEKPALVKTFKQLYKPLTKDDEDGYITIRFVVNCEGTAGMFRMEQLDNNYELKEFDDSISGQILEMTKSLKGWKKGYYDRISYDYYQYLTFKIVDGDIIDYLP